MRKKWLIYSIVCILIISFIISLIIRINDIINRKNSIGYIIEHLNDFTDDIHNLGYDTKVAYTLGELWPERHYDDTAKNKSIGYKNRGILILYSNNTEYHFDIGFDSGKIKKSDFSVVISKTPEKDFNILDTIYPYDISVYLLGEEIDKNSIFNHPNHYTTNFDKYDKFYMYAPQRDEAIKQYIAIEELRQIYKDCIELQNKLINLYTQKKK